MYKQILFFLSLLPMIGNATSITNFIQGVGPQGKITPVICVQDSQGKVTLALESNQSGNPFLASGNANYASAAIRFYGCDNSDSYLGFVEFKLDEKRKPFITKYTAPQGVPIAYVDAQIDDSNRMIGAIKYTPIAYNKDLLPPKAIQDFQFAGINLSGLEFSKAIDPFVIPDLSKENANLATSDLNEIEQFIQEGMNTVRVPVRWGYLQLDGAGKGQINRAYYDNFVRPLLQTLTHAKVHTIIDLHAYMRYATFGEQYAGCSGYGPCPDGTMILDENAYKDVWGKLYDLIKVDPKINQDYVLFDLVNEPVEVPDRKVFTIQAGLIKSLRAKGFDGYILVEGNAWSGLHSWTNRTWQGNDGKTYSNALLFTRDNFNEAGIYDLSKIIINVHQYLDEDYSGTHDTCLQDLTTSNAQGFNLDAFVSYLKENRLKAMVTEFGVGRNMQSCQKPLDDFFAYLKRNSSQGKDYGFVGWTLWSAGHGWGGYNLRVTPQSYQMDVAKKYLQ
jgi:endoglucanase